MMDDDRPRHIGESIDAYIRTHKIDDLFTRMLSATLSERPDNAREYIRKLCSNDNIKEENDTTKMMKEESDDRRKEEQEKKEDDDDREESEDGAVKSKVTVKHSDENASSYLNETLGVSHLFALLSDALVENAMSHQDPLEVLSNTILKLRSSNVEVENATQKTDNILDEGTNDWENVRIAQQAPARVEDEEGCRDEPSEHEEDETEEEEEEEGSHENAEESSEDDHEIVDIVSELPSSTSTALNNGQSSQRPAFRRRQSVSAECIDRSQLLMQMKENESIESIKSLGDKKDASHDKKMDDTVPGKEAKNEGVAATEMEREVLLKIISASPLMSRLSIQIQKELVSNLRKERAFNKGDSIIDQGGTANCLYILEQGECEVFKTVSEEEGAKKVNVVEPGTCFGELGLLHDCPRAASVICSSDDGAVVWSLDRSIFRKLVMFAGASERVD